MNKDIFGIINKPQFDVNIFKENLPFSIEILNNKELDIEKGIYYGLLYKCKPFKLTFIHVIENAKVSCGYLYIDIDQIISGNVIVTPLIHKKEV